MNIRLQSAPGSRNPEDMARSTPPKAESKGQRWPSDTDDIVLYDEKESPERSPSRSRIEIPPLDFSPLDNGPYAAEASQAPKQVKKKGKKECCPVQEAILIGVSHSSTSLRDQSCAAHKSICSIRHPKAVPSPKAVPATPKKVTFAANGKVSATSLWMSWFCLSGCTGCEAEARTPHPEFDDTCSQDYSDALSTLQSSMPEKLKLLA